MAAAASCQTGRFRIAATPVWKAAVIFPAIAAFREKLLTLRTAPFAQGLWLLEKGESDLHCSGVEAGGPLSAFLRWERFLDLTAGIAADEGHPLLEGKPGTTDLATWPCIEFDPPALDILLDRLFRENGKRVTTVLGPAPPACPSWWPAPGSPGCRSNCWTGWQGCGPGLSLHGSATGTTDPALSPSARPRI